MKLTGVTARGIVTPIFKQGDDLPESVCESVIAAAISDEFLIEDGDIVGITESVVARTQGNYATCEQIAADIRNKFGGKDLGLVFPILSRNRFSILLKAIAMGCEKLYVQLSYPSDEVGNALFPPHLLDNTNINPYRDSFDEAALRGLFDGHTVHPFTGVDYIEFYKSFADHIEIVFSNDPAHILNFTKNVLCCDIHTRARTFRIIKNSGCERIFCLSDILSVSVDGSGYNEDYGLLGSNMATSDSVKLFPRDCGTLVKNIQNKILDETGRTVEVLIYGDGCFKDPVGGIWELADPVVSPGYTQGLVGTPKELKIKYFADNDFGNLAGDALTDAIKERIRQKEETLADSMATQGTTPRRYTDLIGSLCDLVSGSGDRGTPVVYIKGYFTNFATH